VKILKTILFFLILATSFLGCPVPGHTEVVAAPYPDSADRTNPTPISTSRVQTQYLNLPMRFEANQGQTDPQVNFLSRGSGYTLFLTPTEAVIVLKSPSSSPSPQWGEGWGEGRRDAPQATRSVSSVLKMKPVGADPSAKVGGLEELPAKSNYFNRASPGPRMMSISIAPGSATAVSMPS